MAIPLSEELWRPTSCSCRGRSGLGGCLEVPGAASPGTWAATSPGPSCNVLAEDKDGSGHAVSRLPALTSEWLASEDELDRLRSSPETERGEVGVWVLLWGLGAGSGGLGATSAKGPPCPLPRLPHCLEAGAQASSASSGSLSNTSPSLLQPPLESMLSPPASLATALWERDVSPPEGLCLMQIEAPCSRGRPPCSQCPLKTGSSQRGRTGPTGHLPTPIPSQAPRMATTPSVCFAAN